MPIYVQRTGLDFMPELAGHETKRIESPSGTHRELWQNFKAWIGAE